MERCAKWAMSLGLLWGALFWTGIAAAQDVFPSKPVRVIVPYAPGGNTDVAARLVGSKLSEHLAQAVVVENRAGAGTLIGSRAAALAPADGYTVLIATPTIAIVPITSRNPGFHMDDFAVVAGLSSNPWVVSVPRALPVTSLQELIAYAKANPGKINNGPIGLGTSTALLAERFKALAGINVVDVPYNSAAPALKDLVAGTVQMVFDGAPTSIGLHRSGQIRTLAVTSPQRMPAYADVPTFQELGFPNMLALAWFGMFAPVKTPPTVLQRLGRDTARSVNDAAVKERLAAIGADPWTGTPEEFAAFLKKDIPVWEEDARRSGIKTE